MRSHRTLTLTLALAVVAAMVEAPAAQVMESAERLARETAALQLTASRRVTSTTRVTAGSAIALGGIFWAVYEMRQCRVTGTDADLYSPSLTASYDSDLEMCALDSSPSRQAPRVSAEPDRDSLRLGAAAGVIALGALLATVWSDVDASDSLIFDVGVDGAAVGKRISW